MRYRFDRLKAIQAAAVLLKQEHGRRTNYMRLLKLLYLADRESIQETSRPITGDRVAAMDRGPVLSAVYDLIKGENGGVAEWDKYLRRDRYELELVDDPGAGELSRSDIRKLRDVSARFAEYDEWELVKYCHDNLPEYAQHEPPKGGRQWIPFEDIFRALGRGDEIARVTSELETERKVDRLFSQALR